ncbi:hypothetical protein PS2015_2251 [Pseudohongiella spirulinae]|uniref:DUF3667 domain-containing protein n=2 Tax=Pseudohongiella spirulinae TaxID=1249552 RepID=A0A0S2KEX0_9GAMM|nr:hypothetical protein PS2015_2251 [Pseudohongiella spirulinae]
MGTNTSDLPEHCLNCRTPLQGQWCHHCGQKAKSQVRHFGSVFMDIMDTVFEYDNRIWRTLVPLYFRPGKITRDYIVGKRARYVLPFRLFFVLSVVSFLILQLFAVPDRIMTLDTSAGIEQFVQLDTPERVIAERDRRLLEVEQTITDLLNDEQSTANDLTVRTLEAARSAINQAADRRLAELEQSSGVSELSGLAESTPGMPEQSEAVEDTDADGGIVIDGVSWSPTDNPVQVSWLPDRGNELINSWMEQGVQNLEQVSDDPRQLVESMLSLLPIVLFFMMPVFALLLKGFYLFSGRIYMEHFVVALHSHSFLFLAMLIALLLFTLQGWTADGSILNSGFNTLYWLAIWWIPLYLLLMQRRMYEQGWIMTLLKYCAVGIVYIFLVVFALLAAALISLVSL